MKIASCCVRHHIEGGVAGDIGGSDGDDDIPYLGAVAPRRSRPHRQKMSACSLVFFFKAKAAHMRAKRAEKQLASARAHMTSTLLKTVEQLQENAVVRKGTLVQLSCKSDRSGSFPNLKLMVRGLEC